MTDKCKTFVARWDHAMCSKCSEEHDRPAPTAAPALDLDAVDAQRSASGQVIPALIAEVRALRAKLAEAKRLGLEACRASGAAPGGAVYAQIAAIAAAMEAL